MLYKHLHILFQNFSVSYYFDYCRFTVSFEIRKHELSNFVLFQDCFGYLGSFTHINLRIGLPILGGVSLLKFL